MAVQCWKIFLARLFLLEVRTDAAIASWIGNKQGCFLVQHLPVYRNQRIRSVGGVPVYVDIGRILYDPADKKNNTANKRKYPATFGIPVNEPVLEEKIQPPHRRPAHR